MILEGLCTTMNDDGTVNVAPMGPIVDAELTSFHFRPFQSSTTFRNLQRTRCGVFHVTDDVQMIAEAAVGTLREPPEFIPAQSISGQVLATACRWYEFKVVEIDDSLQRSEIRTEIVHSGRIRDFFGLNRAKHAVLETAILATRLHLLSQSEVEQKVQDFETIIDKTAGEAEQHAFQFLVNYIHSEWGHRQGAVSHGKV